MPLLSKKNMVAWFRSAKLNLNKPQDFWHNVLWTDETKVEMFGDVHNAQYHAWWKPNTAYQQKLHTNPLAWRWKGDDLGLFCSYRTWTPCSYWADCEGKTSMSKAWQSITKEETNSLVISMGSKLQAIFVLNPFQTKYLNLTCWCDIVEGEDGDPVCPWI